MKIKCSFCEKTDNGTQAELQDKGWSKCMIFAPIRKTIVTCPLHYDEFNLEIMKIVESTKRKKEKGI